MKRHNSKTFALTSLLIALFLAGQNMCAAADPPATQPAADLPARIVPQKDETPIQSLKRGCLVFDQLNVDRAMDVYQYTDREAKYARACVRNSVALTRLEQATRKRFGNTDTARMCHAIGQFVAADLDQAQCTVTGDTATVAMLGVSIPMVKVEGVWKIPVSDETNPLTDRDLADITRAILASAGDADQLASRLEKGEFRDADEAIETIKKIILETPAPDGK